MSKAILFVIVFGTLAVSAQAQKNAGKGIFLENISWTTAKELLTPETVVVIPLGAGAKEHGPHLPLSTDFLQAQGVAHLVAAERKVIITPVVSYGFYPAFLRYAGSTSIDFSTSTEMLLNIVRSLAGYGPRRFYVINIGVSTTPTLLATAKRLADEGILLYYSDYDRDNMVKVDEAIRTQAFGGHANELETSSVLFLHPELVDMRKAVNDTAAKGGKGILSPVKMEGTTFSPSGIIGYAALATKEKGQRFMQEYTAAVVREIDSISTCALPEVKDRTEAFRAYEGVYTVTGKENIIIQAKDHYLQIKQADAAAFMPFLLYCNANDYFSSQPYSILFVKNDAGVVEKAWVRFRAESFWMMKVK